MVTATKQENRLQQYFKDQYLFHQKQWMEVDRELLYTSRLAYWTHWVSLHIDYITFRIKRPNLTKEQRIELINQREELYQFKNLAFLLLLRSKYAKLKAFIPKMHHKLCSTHRKWCFENDGNKPIYYSLENHEQFKECPNCQKGDRHFYSLYAIRIKHEDTKTFFLFHTPYLILKDKIQEDVEDLPQLRRFIGDIGVSKFHPYPNFRKGQKPPYYVFSYELTTKQFKKNYVKLKKYFQDKK
ncbi:hypothetical protein [Bacillus taeanensis]|uniref:Uncharacterized protein n=1 Tax=Bacillus taeanensis TaxID=273032 RepID=A0A366XPF1_9BACI|nr:hypothetical protein [Bacillus taeanensis]RBW68240.1 hypothetical protein DS031_17855 [Bacillus taeanensis]